MIAIDTNLLVYAFDAGAAEHQPARQALSRAQASGRGWGLALASTLEFWSVSTRAKQGNRLAAPGEAAAFLKSLFQSGAMLFEAGEGLGARILAAALQMGVVGARIFDLAIAEAAMAGGATEIWTHDRGFVKLPGLGVRYPLMG